MNLPFFKKFNKKVLPQYFLVLILRDEKAEAVIFEEIAGQAKVVGQKEQHFSASIDNITPEELLESMDKAISSAESSLPENIETQKTIFGIKESWTENDQIKKEYLAKLKKASEELDLIPIGFLVISQAIAHLLQKEEGVPVSAILVEVNKKSVTVTLLRAGKNVETKSSEIHESISFTVDTLLKHFHIPEILPSRIIVFNGKEDLSQEFMSHSWSKSLPFLHLPQITSLPFGFDMKSVLYGAATQMGFEIVETILPKKPEPSFEPLEETAQPIDKEEELLKTPTFYEKPKMTDFGFMENVDVAKVKLQESIEEKKVIELPEENIADEKDIPQIETNDEYVNPIPRKVTNKFLLTARNILLTFLNAIFSVVRRINIKNIFSAPKGKLNIIIPAVLIAIVLIIVSYFSFLKATITINVDPKISEQNKNVIFSTTKDTDPTANIIKGEFNSISEDGSVSTTATGTKDVGTSAKGTVTIFNSLTEDKTLAKGTTIESPNGLDFTLDSSVTIGGVASHSADETVTPQTVKVNVTASQLGKESNLPSGTKFTVASFDTSDVIAKNDNPFSGGTKKQVTVVSKNDSTKLEQDLLKQLETKAKNDLQKQLSQDKILFSTFITETLSKESLSTKVGDEASQVTLTGTADYQGFSYDKNDIVGFSKTFLSKDIPSNETIDYNNIETTVLNVKQENDNEIQANLNVKALLLPKIDDNTMIKNLKGKSFNSAQDILGNLPQVTGVSIKLSPNLPFLPKNLPVRQGNIKISLKING